MEKLKEKAYLVTIVLGAVLILVGIILQVPGGALTTYESLDGDLTNSYVFDNKYSSIDEYVGGDAYNYIIGATLVSGKMGGIIVAKAICIVGGLLCICFGLIMNKMEEKVLELVKEKQTELNVIPTKDLVQDIEENLPKV